MDLDEQAVRSGCNRRPRDRGHQFPFTGAVTRVGDHRQVRERFEDWNGIHVKRIARGGLEGADASLAQHHARISVR